MNSDARAPEYKEAERQAAQESALESAEESAQGSLQKPVVPAPQARAGVTGHNVRYVLGFGIAAVVVAFVIVYLVYVG